jgi:hypothetical protein
MHRLLIVAAAVVLILHGLIHLTGTAAYLKLADVAGLPYKTTLLNGRWAIGDSGIHVLGALWAVAAVGFVVSAISLLAGWTWWRSLMVPVTCFSLVLTTVDWSVAFAGVAVNVVILGLLWLAPRLG